VTVKVLKESKLGSVKQEMPCRHPVDATLSDSQTTAVLIGVKDSQPLLCLRAPAQPQTTVVAQTLCMIADIYTVMAAKHALSRRIDNARIPKSLTACTP
jgi:hypothetical protein